MYRKQRVHHSRLYSSRTFVLASLVSVHLEATCLDDRKAFALTAGRYFHPPTPQPVSPSWYSRISRTSRARKGERRPLHRAPREHCRRKALSLRWPEGSFVRNDALSTSSVLFPRVPSVNGRAVPSGKCHFLVSTITDQNLLKRNGLLSRVLKGRCAAKVTSCLFAENVRNKIQINVIKKFFSTSFRVQVSIITRKIFILFCFMIIPSFAVSKCTIIVELHILFISWTPNVRENVSRGVQVFYF